MDENKIKSYNEIGLLLVNEIKEQIKKAGKVASGDLLNSINYKINTNTNSIEIDLLDESYLLFVDKGRRPGSLPPVKPIENWLDKRGIEVIGDKKSAAFAIAKKIQMKGIPATNIIQKAINIISLQINIMLVDGFGKDLANELVNSLKEIKQNK